MNESILLDALKDIIYWTDEMDEKWGDQGYRAAEAIKKWEDSSGKETGIEVYISIEVKDGYEEPGRTGRYFCFNPNSIPFGEVPEVLRFGSNGQWYNENGDGENPSYWLKPIKLSSLQSIPPYKEEVDKDWEYFWNELMRLQTEKETGVEVIDGLKLLFHLTRKSKDEAVDHEK